MPEKPSAEHDVTVEVMRDVAALARRAPEWQELAGRALESNVFYEPGMLLPALRLLDELKSWRAVLVLQGGRLIGLFPMQRPRIGTGSDTVLELVRHRYSFLHTPLVDRDHASAAIGAWLSWCFKTCGAALVVCPKIALGGRFRTALGHAVEVAGARSLELIRYERPLLELQGDGEQYLRGALSSEKRRRLRQRRSMLEAQGPLTVRVLEADEDPGSWIEAFLELEGRGWKGRMGTAMTCRPADGAYFRECVGTLHRRGQAMLFALTLGERRIAMTCHFRAASSEGAFWMKPAYDEAYGKFSPGVILEAEVLRLLHARFSGVGWVDSCTSPDNELISRMWRGRRLVGTLAVATPGLRGSAALAAAWLRGRGLAGWRNLRRRRASRQQR